MPSGGGAHPALAIATNLTEGRAVEEGLCVHLATWGFVAAVPDLGFTNTDANSIGQTLLDTLDFLSRENARDGSRFQGAIDTAHRGVIGFNTGAMGALVAAGLDDTLSVAVLLDAQDLNGQARNAASHVQHVPVLLVNGDPGVCNGNDSAASVYEQLAGPRSTLHIVAGSDCDAEWPASQPCQLGCGAAHPVQSGYFARFTTAYAAFFAGCNTSVSTHVSGSALDDLVSARNVDHVDQQALPRTCGPYAVLDAGAPTPDAGSGSAPGSGCTSSAPGPLAPLAIIGVALALGLLRRRAM
jgi:dienelactone hydrolase